MDAHDRVLARKLIEDAIRQTESAPPAIAVPARFHIARVLTAWSNEEAKALLISAIQQLAELLRTERGLDVLIREAYLLTAATAPALIENLPPLPTYLGRDQFQLVRTMLNHDHAESACDYLLEMADSAEFPQFAVAMVLAHTLSEDRRLALARRSVAAWRNLRGKKRDHARPPAFELRSDFVRSFTSIWKILPEEEAGAVLRELVTEIRKEKDFPMTGNIDPEGRIVFTSMRQYRLFELLEAIRELAPALMHSLLRPYPELAGAAKVFPFGERSVREAWERKAANRNPSEKRGRIVGGGSQEDFMFGHALLDSAKSKDFSQPLRMASRTLDSELKENGAPKECWASSQAFRQIFYSAGAVVGGEAQSYLESIQDSDIRMFSQIELAAALAGLPEYAGSRASRPKSQGLR